jgi:predicted Zn finger-like uncharacterized protein
MNVTCNSCAARYAVPDAKVQGRRVRIRCKKCQSPILIDGTSLLPEPATTAEDERAARRAKLKQTMIGVAPPSGVDPDKVPPSGDSHSKPRAHQKTIVGGVSTPRPRQQTMLGGVGAKAGPSRHRPQSEPAPAPPPPPASEPEPIPSARETPAPSATETPVVPDPGTPPPKKTVEAPSAPQSDLPPRVVTADRDARKTLVDKLPQSRVATKPRAAKRRGETRITRMPPEDRRRYLTRADYRDPWRRTDYYECAGGSCDCDCERPYWASSGPCWD